MIKERIIIISLFLLGLIISTYSLFQTSYAPGWDSYFYIDQIKSWFETGILHSSRLNIIYPLLIGIQFLTDDYILSYKVLTILSFSLCAPLLFLIGKNLKLSFWHSVLIALLFVANPASTYFASQFTKNLVSILILLILILQLVKRNHIAVIALLLVLAFSHKLTFAIALLIYLLNESYLFLKQKKLNYIAPFCLFPLAFLGFYLVSTSNLGVPQFHLWSLYTTHHLSLTTATFIASLISFLLLLWSCYRLIIQSRYNSLQFALIATLSFLLFPFLKWDLTGYSFRFLMMFLVLSPLLISGMLINTKWTLPLSIISLPLCFFSLNSYKPKVQDPHYIQYEYISNSLNSSVVNTNTELIICHKSLAEFLSYNLNKDVLPWGIPNNEVSSSTFRLAYFPHNLTRELNEELNNKGIQKITSNYFYMPEETWSSLIQSLNSSQKENLLTWRNPTSIRTNSIIK